MTSSRAPFTLAGALHGARLALPLLPGILVFATAFGTAAAQKGLTLGQTMGLSAFVFAGAAQMVALQLWQEVLTPSTLLGLVTVTATINSRMILMGAAVQPWMAGRLRARDILNLFLMADANWLIATRYHAEGGRDLGVMLGAGVAFWIVWTAATLPGYLAGALIQNPRAIGLDLVMPIFFAAMLVPLWRGLRPAVPWLIAGLVALAVEALVGGYVFILAGALAGMTAGALMSPPGESR